MVWRRMLLSLIAAPLLFIESVQAGGGKRANCNRRTWWRWGMGVPRHVKLRPLGGC
ncbi:hypothetical protein SAMN05443247_09400 [Bradyrhizobium erythrophlei]|nr:hypothetical protein SAMN05443247_09400 [Bradyrhizobium erythrophlei]